MVPRDILDPQAHGILDLPEVPVRQAPQAILVQMVMVVPRALQAIPVQMATTATTVRRALQAILEPTVKMATTVRRGLLALTVKTVRTVSTVSRPQIKV